MAQLITNYPNSIVKYATLAVFPTTAQNGDFGVALDTDFLYVYNGAAWVLVGGGGGGAITAVADTNSIDLTIAATVLTADLKLSAVAAAAANQLVSLDVQADGLRAQLPNASIIGQTYDVFNTRGAPLAITAVGGISFASLKPKVTQFIQGSGGPITITANPQIVNSLGNFVGQRLLLIPVSNVNTVTINTGTGTDVNGSWTGNANNAIEFEFDGTNYYEINRRQ